MKIFLTFILIVFFSSYSIAQTDSTLEEEEYEYEYDTVVVEEEPVLINTGKYNVFTDKYSSIYLSAFVSVSNDFSWYKANEGYEEYFKKLQETHKFDFTRDLGLGIYYLPKENKSIFYNGNILYSRYHQRHIYKNKSYTGRRTNVYQYFGADVKVGNWFKRTSNKSSFMLSAGYRIEFRFKRVEEALKTEDTDYTIANPFINRYQSFNHYLSLSGTYLLRIKRFKIGIEPYFLASLQKNTRPNQPFDQRIFKCGIKSSFILSY